MHLTVIDVSGGSVRLSSGETDAVKIRPDAPDGPVTSGSRDVRSRHLRGTWVRSRATSRSGDVHYR